MSHFSTDLKTNIPVLGKDNYSQWAFRVREYLESRNVRYLIDQSEATSTQRDRLDLALIPADKIPNIAASELPDYHLARDKFLEDTAVARAFIGAYLDDTNSQHIQDIRDPCERWNRLADIHRSEQTGSKLLYLRSLLQTDGFETVESQLTHVQEMTRILSAICCPTEDTNHLPRILIPELAAIAVLWNLGPEFEGFVT